MDDAVKNALRLARQGRMPLHQAIARSGYEDGGTPEAQPGDTAHEFVNQELYGDLAKPSPVVEQYAAPTAEKAVSENEIKPQPTSHEFVQQALNKQEPQLPQMDREAYERMKYGAPEALKDLGYFTPAAPASAAYDVYQGMKSGSPAEVAMGATGLPGRTAKALGIAGAAMMPEDAQANFRRFGLDWALKAAENARGLGQGMKGGPNLGVFHSTEGRHLPDVMKRFEGTIPAPSLAIARPELDMSQFGDTVLVGRPHLAVPTEENPIWRADAYTPRHPKIYQSSGDIPELMDTRAKQYLEINEGDRDKAVEHIKRDYEDNPFMGQGLAAYVSDPEGYKLKEFIYKSPQDKTRVAPTVENVIEHMRSGNIAGGEGGETGNAGGIGLIKALASPKFKTIEEIQQAGKDMPFDEQNRDWSDILSDMEGRAGLLQSKHVNPENKNYGQNLNAAMIDYLRSGDEADFLKHYPKADKFDIARVNNLIENLRRAPASYFEAKPLRPVGMDEFAGALIPASNYFEKTKGALSEAGMDPASIHLYDPNSPAMKTKMLRERFGEHFFADGGEVNEPGADASKFEQEQLHSGEQQLPQYVESHDFPAYLGPNQAEASILKPMAGVIERGLAASKPLNKAAMYFEVAPGKNWAPEAKEAWESLPNRAKNVITNEAVQRHFPSWQERSGISGNLRSGLGGFEGSTNPNLIYYLNDPAYMPSAMRDVGEMYAQDAMMGVSKEPFEGAQRSGLLTLGVPKGIGKNDVHDIYETLLRHKLTEGHSTDPAAGRMTMLAGPGGEETKEIGKEVASVLKNRYPVISEDRYVSFPEAGENYGFGDRSAAWDRRLLGAQRDRELLNPRHTVYGGEASALSGGNLPAYAREDVRKLISDVLGRTRRAEGGRAQRGPGGLIKLGQRLGKLMPEGSGYLSLPGKPATVNLPGIGRVEARPIHALEESANKIIRAQGRDPEVKGFTPINPEYSARVAEAYERMKHDPNDPVVKRAYDALIEDTMAQYRAAKDTGIDFRFLKPGQKDPYAASPALGYEDIVNRGRLYVYPTDSGFGTLSDAAANNPLLTRVGKVGDLPNATANDAFRIAHDVYGHFGPGNPFFRGAGEERAYQLHSRMFSPEALPAAAAETRGQNSWVNYGPHKAHNAQATGDTTVYADQKAGVLPEWATAAPPPEGADVDAYIQSIGKKASGGSINMHDDVKNALRIAGNRRAYATDGAVEDTQSSPVSWEAQKNLDYMNYLAQQNREQNELKPSPNAHEFVQQALNKGEPQLPQMDRETYNAMKYGAPKMAAYGVPVLGEAMMGYDLAKAGQEMTSPEFRQAVSNRDWRSAAPTVMDAALSAAGLPGKGLKGLAVGAGLTGAAMEPGEAQAGEAVGLAKKILGTGKKAAKAVEPIAPEYLQAAETAKKSTEGLRGRTAYGEEQPLMFQGKQPHEFEPADWGAFGREHGVKNLGPESNEAFEKSLVPITTKYGKTITVPGGIENTEQPFTYYDLLHLKSQGIDPNDLDPDTHRLIHNRMMTTMSPEGDVSKERMFNQYLMGMISPNNPLTPNQFAVASMMAKEGGKDIENIAKMTPWELETQPPSTAQRTVRGPLSANIATQFGLQAANKGGLGAVGSPDYTRISDFAKMMEKDPEFFRFKEGKEGGKTHAEDWMNFVTKIASQVPGLSAKTGSFATVWQNPKTADISAIDRHMASLLNDSLFANPKEKKEFEKKVVNYFNKDKPKKEQVKGYSDVLSAPGGRGAYVEQVMQHVNKHGSAKLRTPSGEIGKGVPEHLRDVNWVQEPKEVVKLSPGYLRALDENAADAARNNQGLFANQWMLWDRIRNRIEPHEVMFPGLEKLPRMAQQQLLQSMGEHRKAGYLTSPAQVRQVKNPSSLAHFGLVGAPGIGAYMAQPEKDEETPPET